MKRTNRLLLAGALAMIAGVAAPAFAQSDAASDAAGAAAAKKSHGTTLHQQNKAHKLRGASAAAAASALGTNDRGQPQ